MSKEVRLVASVNIDPIPTDAKGIVRGATITVKGTAQCDIFTKDTKDPDSGGSEDGTDAISEVAVQFGPSGTFVTAKPTGPVSQKTHQKTWVTWTTDPRIITGAANNTLKITARVTAGKGAQAVEVENTLTVAVDSTPPVLSLTTPDEMTQAVVNGKTTFQLAGTASDDLSPVVAVEWVFGQGEKYTAAIPRAPGDWSSWTAAVQVSPAGNYEVNVRARDGEGNTTPPKKVTLHAVEKFQPQDPSDVFSQAAYLDDLLHFASLRMVDAEGKLLTPERFATAFRQRYKNSDLTNPNIRSDLTNPNNREVATASVRQVRVCVEVLRAFLASIGKSAKPAEETKYRQAAYAALLTNIGTSSNDLRRARGNEAARLNLAARLGVDRPDRLDQLLLLPEQITEATLEQLFGLQDTTRDPLVRGPKPLLLTWQLDRLRAQWQEQDNAARIYDDIRVPIIDSDRLVKTDFRTRNQVADPAFKLWNARKDQMTVLLKQIDDLRKSKGTSLAGFDVVVSQFVTKVEDLTALLTDYQAGKEVAPRLTETRLDMAAFLTLMRIRDLAASGTVLDADWADVYAIAAQVFKLNHLYPDWRTEEEQAKGLILGPDYFVLPDPTAPSVDLPEWRATLQARRAWQVILQTRINQQQDVIRELRDVVDATEAETLPGLRDLLVAAAGDAAGGLLIDLAGGVAQQTTRLAQAIETLQVALFTVRVGAFAQGHPAAGWKLKLVPVPTPESKDTYTEADFDTDWETYGAQETWQGAMRVFIFPESHLLPTLRPADEPTKAFHDLVKGLRGFASITPSDARQLAETYLKNVSTQTGVSIPAGLALTDRLTDTDLEKRRTDCATLFTKLNVVDPHLAPNWLKEIFFCVPLLIGLQLQRSGEFLTAIDWFQTVYAYYLPPPQRKIYGGLTLEESINSKFERSPNWPREGLNPHKIVRARANALTSFVIISLVRCFKQFADAEFTKDTNESISRARTLYRTALDLLDLAYPAVDPTTAPANPFGLDPVVEALRLHADLNLRKLRLGRNIAGLERQLSPELAAGTAVAPRQPTPYRYAALITRARDFTQTASQMETALLVALEKREGEQYNLLRAIQDVELAGETVFLHALQVKEASDGIKLAALQKQRAKTQFDHFSGLLNDGRNVNEKLAIGAEIAGLATSFGAGLLTGGFLPAAGLFAESGGLGNIFKGFGQGGSFLGGLGSLFGQFGSNERREEDWRLQRDLAEKDEEIGSQQLILAADKVVVATQEQKIAQIQKDHATANVHFLAGKFTNAELYEFMSEVLDGVYRFFLQQATAMAKLAESQLAFERQEPPQGLIQGDYYAVPDNAAAGNGPSDRRGITGSARLLADIAALDQHAFLTNRRSLQLTMTLSSAQFAPIEFARFRETGVLVIGTPQSLFDRDFPGHYLRLVKRVRTSVIALIPPTRGIRATLSTSGTSRVVIGGDTFRNVVVRRDPEAVGLSSPRDATGLFELVPDSQPELLLPFEGSGVDTVWRFELPKAANPFDYSTIADVLLTIEYTALNSFDYREQVIQTLDPAISLDRPFSFQQQFPDQWYDLNNPDQTPTPMVVRFETTREDFLPNIDDLKIQHLVLYFAPTNGQPVEIRSARLLFKKQGDQTPVGGSADSIDGVISTRRTNGSSWVPITGNKPPIGEWELALPTDETTKNFFRNGEIEDILFVITYSGLTPEWPI